MKWNSPVLPAIPNVERPPTGILLTDSESRLWQKSNPKAYGDWFYGRMKTIFDEKRAALAESIRASVEEVPEWQVKTPLQIAVQILKRHRDIHFRDAPDLRPVSIIITTLAARSYENQPDAYEAVSNTVRKIVENWGRPGFVEYRNGKWWVANPVDDGENFADKWNEYPERREAFLTWIRKADDDFASAALKRTLNESATELTRVLGSHAIAEAAADLGLPLASTLPAIKQPRVSVPALGDCRHCAPPQWPLATTYRADLAATVYSGRKKLWNLTDRSVPKHVGLRFSVRTNVPQPYYVSWQVVNTGQEASDARSLRGGFYESEVNASDVRWEYTHYAGTHWVEAFIVKNGVCVARSGRKYIKIR